MNSVEHLLRRIALDDDRSVRDLLSEDEGPVAELDGKLRALVRLAALLSAGAATVSLRRTIEQAYAAGATEEEILGVLLSIGSSIGQARAVAAAPQLALALGYDVDSD